jgi:pheromone alpha factor receptor
MVALLLPLSSLWAGMAIDHEASTLDLAHLTGSHSAPHCSGLDHGRHGSLSNQSRPLATNSSPLSSSTAKNGSVAQINPVSIDSRMQYIHSCQRDSTELDLEAMGIRVDKSYEVYEVRNKL